MGWKISQSASEWASGAIKNEKKIIDKKNLKKKKKNNYKEEK